MHVIATAGHVDHGKSTLVRALTGMEPDRWAEEQRRGLTIGLGFAWTTINDKDFAFVDVPGHERFVSTMMAGVGPVPAVLFVVAADGGWMPQSAEHLAVLDALGVAHGLLVITRADLADPEPARQEALARLSRTSLGTLKSVVVSPDSGIPELQARLAGLALPPADPDADVRLWIDRVFTIEGAGTVVTGTLSAGTISTGDELVLADRIVHVKGIQSLGKHVSSASAVARVALNLRGVERSAARRGQTLLTPHAWAMTKTVDVKVNQPKLPGDLMAHIGSAAVPARVRPLGTTTARLALNVALPLRIGDRLVLRDPSRHEIAARADVLDVDPPALNRRGDARRRGTDLDDATDLVEFHLRQRRFLRAEDLRTLGLPMPDAPQINGWYTRTDVDIESEVAEWAAENPLQPGIPLETLRQRLALPDVALVAAFAEQAGLTVTDGRIRTGSQLPQHVQDAVNIVTEHLRDQPFRAPEAGRLRELGLGPKELGAAVRVGALAKIADGVVLLPDAIENAGKVLERLDEPFTPAMAKQALDSTRRVVVPLLERLDELGVTQRRPDGTRTICGPRELPVP